MMLPCTLNHESVVYVLPLIVVWPRLVGFVGCSETASGAAIVGAVGVAAIVGMADWISGNSSYL